MASLSASTAQCELDCLAWLALTLTPALGAKRIVDAVAKLDAPGQIFELPLTGLEALHLPAEAAQFIFDGKARAAAEAEYTVAQAGNARLVTLTSEEYPERLKEIYDPPPVLWVRGDHQLLQSAAIAVVGTRHPSPYGTGVAEMLSRDLAARGLLIVSGMARGIDTCAHKGALAARKPTLAIWGTGIDVVYPKENKKLAEDILSTGGAIVSELPAGTFPDGLAVLPRELPAAPAMPWVCGGSCSGVRVTLSTPPLWAN